MIDLYTWPTPNGHKLHILLEELALPYNVIPVNIGAGEQFDPEFLKISPNNKMPALVDRDGPGGEPIAIFESGAMMLYLAEKTGKLMPTDLRGRYEVVQWLMFQMASVGPFLGQIHHFVNYAPEKISYAIDRYTNEGKRLYGVVDRRLADRDFVAGAYSIADIAIYPWFRNHERQGIDLAAYPRLERWYRAMEARPAVQRGVQVLADRQRKGPVTETERENLFGATQYAQR